MGQIIRCPLTGIPCPKPTTIQEKTFFLAEAEKPEDEKRRRIKALNEAIGDGYKIRSALEEKGINAFTCRICEMIQTCAYGMADITSTNPNVLLELGMMIALGKPTIILCKRGEEQELKLPSDLSAIEVIPFTEYIDVIDQLRKVVEKLPSPLSPPSPIQDLEKIQPHFAQELRKMQADIVREFRQSIGEAKLDTSSLREEKIEIPRQLGERIGKLEEKLEDIVKLGFTTDARTAFSRGNFYYHQGRYEDALASYNWSLELEPDDHRVLNNRGNTYAKLEKYDAALTDYSHALELMPDDYTTLYNRANTYERLEKYDEALSDYNRLLEFKPDDPDLLNDRSIAYLQQKSYDDSFHGLDRALQLKPDHSRTLYNLACLFSLWGKSEDALDYLEKAIEIDKKNREDAKTDKDFDNIRDDPRFKKLVEPD
jgi:tetratricopeptide (TPR) repeat protein